MKCKECGAPINKNETECKECNSTVKKEKSIIYNNKDVKELKLGLNVKDPITISKDNKDKQKQSLLFKALIVVAVLIVISSGYLVYLIVDTGKVKDNDDKGVVESPKEYKRIGSKDHGYINIPEKWVEQKNPDNELIYYNNDEESSDTIIMSVASKTETSLSAEKKIEELYEELVEAKAKDIIRDEITVENYKVYQIHANIEGNVAYAWTFEDNSSKIQIITLLYSGTDNDLSQIIQSYKSEN